MKRPEGEAPTREDVAADNISNEWREYYKEKTELLFPGYEKLLHNRETYRQEAEAIFKELRLTRLPQFEQYITDHPPSAGAIIMLMQIAQEKLKSHCGRINKIKSQSKKEKEKSFIKECWFAWQQHPKIYSGKAAFARDMLDKCKDVKNQAVIERWCRDWEKENSISYQNQIFQELIAALDNAHSACKLSI